MKDIKHVQVYAAGTSGTLPWRNIDSLAKTTKTFGLRQLPTDKLVFRGSQPLLAGTNHFYVSVKLKEKADVSHRIGLRCVTMKIGQRKVRPKLLGVHQGLRFGYALRKGGDDGSHTFRIPGLVTTNRGTLVGVYDVRRRSGRDLPGDIDVGMSRSTDGGRTWEPMRIIMDMGMDPKWRYDGIGDPAVLVDRKTGTIWVAATWSHGNRSWFGSGPGLKPAETGQLMLVRSDDDGRSWSKPINITSQVKRPEWCFLLQGPGKGITMRDGTLVFAAQFQDTPANKRLPRSTILYSKDHGKTWRIGTGAFDDTTEAQVVEVEPGVLMLNCRYNRASTRVVMTTRDMGKTWQPHPTSRRSLIEPRACMASLIDVDREAGKKLGGWLLFSNPDSTRGRSHITIKASNDGGKTWPMQHRLLLDEGRGAGYSCMTMIDEKTIGILYEGSGAHLVFQRIPLDGLIRQRKPFSQPKKAASLRLPQVFGNHMVLQSGREIPVWGTARPGAKVTAKLGEDQKSTVSDAKGNWQVRFPARKPSTKPIVMLVKTGRETVIFRDVLVGEVWVCAGQSNMEWPLHRSTNGEEELTSTDHPTIRLLNLVGGARGSSGSYTREHLARLSPDRFCKGAWEVASPTSARGFSAVAWYFGRHLAAELKVPIGLICPAVGGSPTEAWIPRDALQRDPHLKTLVHGNWLDNQLLGEFCRKRGTQNLLRAIQAGEHIPGDGLGPNHSFKPAFMWDAGIKPLIPYAIRGVIWYQGESNAESRLRVRQHGRLFPLMVKEWRKRWKQESFPFLYVQLPALKRDHWPLFRDQQRRFLKKIDNAGMAVTIDTGHPTNVHPTLKKPVGERLATWALGTTYDVKTKTTPTGPLLDGMKRIGKSVTISFDHFGKGLTTTDGKPPRHFEIAGDDGVFHPATAKLVGKNAVDVMSPRVVRPSHVRYAWRPFPTPRVNLVNSAHTPASPFSTRDEEKETQEANDKRPNILLIVGEDHGCELSCYGDPVIKTPHIDRLASQGVLFQNGYVTQSVCSPSRSTIFTGLYPHQNGQLGLATHKYSWFKKWPTTYSLLKKAGYRTGLIGKTHILPLDAVEPFVDFRFQKSSNFRKRKVADYASQAGKFFRASDKPFFMTVNYPDAHWPLQDRVDGLPSRQVDPKKVRVMPYVGGETPRLRKIAGNYYNSMLRLDECVGQLLNQLKESGKADNTLVVFIGDHGAQMARGKVTVYEGGMRTPFIARWPRTIKPGQRSKTLVSTIDLLPTFMDCAGTDVPKGLPGKSLRPVFTGTISGEGFRKYVSCERNCDAARHTFPQRTIRDSRYKLIFSPIQDREDPAARYYRVHGAAHWSGCLTDKELAGASRQTRAGYARWLKPPVFQLYDLQTDPHEWRDLANDPAHKPTKTRLITALKKWQAATRDPLTDPKKLQMLMAENDAVFKSRRRFPKDGWQYLRYLAPGKGRVIFERRDIPSNVPRKGHSKTAKTYGYRIPSLLVTQEDSILAFSERRLGLHDHAQNDIVLRRSTDGGKTWSNEIVAYEDGMNSINDPLTVQLKNGRILLMFARFPYGRHARDAGWIKMADLGYDDPKANVLTFICHSDDDGLTWSKPVDISRQVKPPHLLNANTPGAMIQLSKGPHKGRLVTGLWGTLPRLKDGKRSREWQIVVAYSDDNGKSWKRTKPLKDVSGKGFPNECQVAEASNGDIVLISRNQGGDRFRKKAISRDGGETWSTIDIDRGLPSVACMGSVIKGPVKKDGTWDLWASFPSSAGRKDGQIAVSKDNGKTWQIVKVIHGPFAYSALQISPDKSSLLCLYESDRYRSETLLTIPFDEVGDPISRVKTRPNVLFIAVDDWNGWVGCLGNKQAKTPNVDRLANRGLVFTNAHCVAPVCNPSRVAVLTGLRPGTTGVYENNHVMRRKSPGVVTLPQYFRASGYHVAGGGKVFHDVPPHCHDPKSWDEYYWWNKHGPKGGRFGGAWRSPYSIPPDPQLDGRPIREITRLTKRNFDWGTVDQTESDWPDSKVASWAAGFLSRKHAKPFFLAVGIFRPHVPWFNPRKYVEQYPLDKIALPNVKADDLKDLGTWAKKRAHDRASKHEQLVKFGEWKPAVQAYLASISFADANVGRVLDALQKSKYRDNTIVVLWSDHGYHLGEKGHWHKRTLWERSTRVPFVVVAPGITKAGTKCMRPVSLLDIYPTLVSLCGLDARSELEGHDLTSLLKMPQAEWPHPAITTYQRGNHSVRTEKWRYIRYGTGEEELYDHNADPKEWHNLASNKKFADTKQKLARHIPHGKRGSRTK